MKLHLLLAGSLCVGVAIAQGITCDLHEYKSQDGLKADMRNNVMELSWQGARGQELRAAFTIRDGQPTIVELPARKGGGVDRLGRNLTPEFEVTSGKRRLSEQQMAPLRKLGIQLTPEVVDREKWNAFWDAPLMVPGLPTPIWTCRANPRRSAARGPRIMPPDVHVKTDGARLEVEFPGLDMGIFSGSLRYTVYEGRTCCGRRRSRRPASHPWRTSMSGPEGLAIGNDTRVVWRDVARAWQQYGFGGRSMRIRWR